MFAIELGMNTFDSAITSLCITLPHFHHFFQCNRMHHRVIILRLADTLFQIFKVGKGFSRKSADVHTYGTRGANNILYQG